METDLDIILYDQLPENLRSGNMYNSLEKYHSDYFWKYCAEGWHKEYIHKVYVLVPKDKKQVLGFFSLRANEIEIRTSDEKHFIPIADVAFIDVHEDLSEYSSSLVIRSLLEYIEHICLNLVKSIGCRYIRCYLPTYPKITGSNKVISGEPLLPALETIFAEMKYFEPPVKESNKIRKIRNRSTKNIVIVLKYYIRDLLT